MTMDKKVDHRRIVSSRHLASSEAWQLSEFEYGLIVAYNAFTGWVTRCMSATGSGDFNTLDILVLHHINHRERPKKLSDICFVLNIEDTHTVNYSLKKLAKLELIEGTKQGKEIFYIISERGADVIAEYSKIREQCLLEGLHFFENNSDTLSEVAAALRSISGLYDQASRAASSL